LSSAGPIHGAVTSWGEVIGNDSIVGIPFIEMPELKDETHVAVRRHQRCDGEAVREGLRLDEGETHRGALAHLEMGIPPAGLTDVVATENGNIEAEPEIAVPIFGMFVVRAWSKVFILHRLVPFNTDLILNRRKRRRSTIRDAQ
jgi:hypothetical protein